MGTFSEDKSTIQGSCLICGEKKIYYNFSIERFRIEKCSNCALMRINPQPTKKELSDKSNKEGDNSLLFFNEKYLHFVESYSCSDMRGQLLYIGYPCDSFKQLIVAKGLCITEISVDENGFEEDFQSRIKELLNKKNFFDYIFLVNVLHRVRNPRSFLRQIRLLLKVNGISLTILPSVDSITARLMKSRWVGFNPKNFWYFSKCALSRLFYEESFEELKFDSVKKPISLDHLYCNVLRYSKQPFSILIKLTRLLPNFLRKQRLNLRTSEVFLLAKGKKINPDKKLTVIMPAFNEAATIQNTIDRVLAKKIEGVEIELIIIESNSTDGTREIVKQYDSNARVKIIWQESPKGKGSAVREGLLKVSGDFILIQDADSEYDIEDYDALLQPLVSGEATFVLGARHGGGAWKMRQFEDQKLIGHILNVGHWVFATLINITYGLKLKDPFTMYKVFRTDCLRGIKLECNRFDFDHELLIKLVKNGHYPIEIPVNYRSRSFKEGKKVSLFRDPCTWLVAIIKYRFV